MKTQSFGRRREFISLLLLLLALLLVFAADLLYGSVHIEAHLVWAALRGDPELPQKYSIMVLESRLPRALTAMLAGAGLGVSGLIMQTFFRNPVAGPYILGISSGASLGVALLLMGGMGWQLGALGAASAAAPIVVAAALGAALVMGLMMLLSVKVRDPATLLIIGLMLGSFTGAIVAILQYSAGRESLRHFIYWSFGSLDHTHWAELGVLAPLLGLCLLVGWLMARPFDLMALGDDYARTSGLPLLSVRIIMVALTALLAGSVTAYCGPIAFIGVAVPHMARALSGQSSHRVLLPYCLLCGALLLTACDLMSRLPGRAGTLPINAITSLIGAPAVLVILWRARRVGQFFQQGQ